MSEGFSIRVKRDDITPDIRKKLKGLENPEPILRAMGTQLVSLTKRAFRDQSLRQIAWPDKSKVDGAEATEGAKVHKNQHGSFSARSSRQGGSDGSGGGPSNLIRKGTLMASIRITSVTKRNVMIGTDRIYGAIHQLGGVIRPKNGKALVFTIGGRTIFAQKVTIPARPYFPFTPDGRLASIAIEPVREALLLASNKALGIET